MSGKNLTVVRTIRFNETDLKRYESKSNVKLSVLIRRLLDNWYESK